jgi:hypothetical protein
MDLLDCNIYIFIFKLNGTACAVPRLLTTIIENNWDHEKKLVHLPTSLQPYMNNRKVLRGPSNTRRIEMLRKSDYEEMDARNF